MKRYLRRIGAFGAVFVMVGALAGPAWAGGEETDAKCNAGRGNGSELVLGVDCDPGNSGGHNQGGD